MGLDDFQTRFKNIIFEIFKFKNMRKIVNVTIIKRYIHCESLL